MKMKELETNVEIINELEGGELVVEDFEDLERLTDICEIFASSQGFYGRLLRDIRVANISEEDFPIIF